ncbi:MAG: alpha/beta hydrolase [Candidatus Hydrogenedentota bacterium]
MKNVVLMFWTVSLFPTFLTVADEIDVMKDVAYLEGANYADNKDKLDLYMPKGDGPHPVVIFIHGGGLLRGSKDPYGFVDSYFAQNGFVAVIPNHRLSPSVKHPAHIEDIAASFAWVHENITKHRGNPMQIFVTGHSAGAYLAGLLACDACYLAAHDLKRENIAGVIPISGFYHVERLATGRPKSVWGENAETWLAASPAQYTDAAVPPILFLYADGDAPERRKESEDMVAALREAGHSNASTKQIDDRDHVSIARKLASEGDETAPAMLAFMNQILLGEHAPEQQRAFLTPYCY